MRSRAALAAFVMVGVLVVWACAPFGSSVVTSNDAGSNDGAPPGDASPIADAGDVTLTFVQHAEGSGNGSPIVTNVAPTKEGNLIAVLVQLDTASASVTGVTDDTPGGSSVYLSTGQRNTSGYCNQSGEIWYARARGAATKVTVALKSAGAINVWVTELAGLPAGGGFDVGAVDASGSAGIVNAPAPTPSGLPAFIVSVIGSCGEVGEIRPPNPFTALPKQNGNRAAYFIAIDGGPFGPVLDNSSGGWNASTAAFR